MGLLICWPASRFFFCFSNATSPCPKRTETETGFRCRNQTKLPAVVAARGLGSVRVWMEWNGPMRWAQPISNMSRSLAVCHDSAAEWGTVITCCSKTRLLEDISLLEVLKKYECLHLLIASRTRRVELPQSPGVREGPFFWPETSSYSAVQPRRLLSGGFPFDGGWHSD